jgi:hypothetical protein
MGKGRGRILVALRDVQQATASITNMWQANAHSNKAAPAG